jgi:uncharacterized protein (TIGR03437 family)
VQFRVKLFPMGKRLARIGKTLVLLLSLSIFSAAFAQNSRVTLAGHMRPAAIPANDRGRVDSSLQLRHVTLMLPPSFAKQADLDTFLAQLQDPASPGFHRWLTPEQYGARFGAATIDIGRVSSWLRSQNLTVDSVGRGRTTIVFTGAAHDVENAFQIEIHNYLVNGEMHYANAGEPSMPAALGGLVRWIRGLDDFRLQPIARKQAQVPAKPSYTSVTTGYNYIAPNDMATMFDITALYNTGITGRGQQIVVVGQTDINLSDIEQFRSYFNLSATDPQTLLVPGTSDPGFSANDLPEASLDIEWSGAIARDATIVYVYSLNVNDSLDYAINQNLAPVITMSYGECEQLTGSAALTGLRTYAQQAAAQGISWITASGDDGANGCYGQDPIRGITGLSVDQPASIPEVTGVGGTTLNEAGGNYWSATNDGYHASVLSYIPETTWNDTAMDGSPSASTGGASVYFIKPAWQTGSGVPNDGWRDVPDIAMPASADHDAYMVYTSGVMEAFGGTSVGSPVFAGITGLLNQYMTANGLQATAGQGNLNPRLYALASSTSSVFHDITSGNNMVPSCSATERNCVPTQVGFTAGPGYDQTTGLGSVDAYNLIALWPQSPTGGTFQAAVQLTSSVNPLPAAGSTILTATVSTLGGKTPTGAVTFYLAGTALGSATLGGSGLTVTTKLSVQAAQLTVGQAQDPSGALTADVTPDITAVYSGDSIYASCSVSLTIFVVAPSATAISGTTSAASFLPGFAPGMIAAMFGQNLASGTPAQPGSPLPTQLAGTTITLNGIPAPLYYVSPSQINLQIPYEIPGNSTAIVKVSSNGQTSTSQIFVSATAPGVFADGHGLLVPYQATGRGQSIVLFETGDGQLSPPPATGVVPQSGVIPVPKANVSITVGGVQAATPFAFIGVPEWSIGVTQINFTIPSTAPLGLQSVVVTAGGVSSAPVFITVTP